MDLDTAIAGYLANESPTPVKAEPVKAEPAAVEASPAPAASKPKFKPEPESKSKSPWDKLDSLDVGEEAAPDAGQENAPKDDGAGGTEAKPEANGQEKNGAKPDDAKMTRWKELRKAEEELGTLKPQLQQKDARIKELEEQLASSNTEELGELRKWKAAFDVKNSDKYIEAVGAPIATAEGFVAEVADYLKIDPIKLFRAMESPKLLERNRAIQELVRSSDEDLDSGTLSKVFQVAEDLHHLYAEGARLEAEALEIRRSMEGADSVKAMERTKAMDAEYSKAHGEIFDKLAAKLPQVMTKDIEAEMRAAKPAPDTDHMGRSYEVQAGVLLPHVARQNMELRKEIAEMKASLQARANANPSIRQTAAVEPSHERKQISLDEAAAAYLRGA